MTALAVHTGPAVAVKPSRVPQDPAKARALFLKWRFAENGGAPFCPRCNSDVVYEYKCRDEFKCKACDKRFSPTSGTPWAYRKLPYYDILYIFAKFCNDPDGVSANDLSDDLERHYKTAFLWLHKFRQEVTDFMEKAILGGETEIDGGYFGGKMRPKNVKKERGDLRTIPYRDAERAMSVTFAVERGGAIRSWIAKHEGHPRKQIERALAVDAVLFTDSAPSWNAFRGKRRLLQVNHNQAYMTPEACTNAVESTIRSLRAAEDVHRHIVHNYFDLYAGEVAWRVTHNGQRKSERFETLMSMMSRSGRSSLAGYFQGKKRQCRIVDASGEMALWSPPTRSDRDRLRALRGQVPIAGPYRPRRTAANWHNGFEFLKADSLSSDWQQVKDRPGVYIVCVPEDALSLPAWGYEPEPTRPLWRKEGFAHVYTGETYGLRSRLREHLIGDVGRSTLRETLAALQWRDRRLVGKESDFTDRGGAEAAVTDWLLANALIGFKASPHVRDYERDILHFAASPLNVRRDSPTSFSQWLKTVRREFRDSVMSIWEPLMNQPRHQPRR